MIQFKPQTAAGSSYCAVGMLKVFFAIGPILKFSDRFFDHKLPTS